MQKRDRAARCDRHVYCGAIAFCSFLFCLPSDSCRSAMYSLKILRRCRQSGTRRDPVPSNIYFLVTTDGMQAENQCCFTKQLAGPNLRCENQAMLVCWNDHERALSTKKPGRTQNTSQDMSTSWCSRHSSSINLRETLATTPPKNCRATCQPQKVRCGRGWLVSVGEHPAGFGRRLRRRTTC